MEATQPLNPVSNRAPAVVADWLALLARAPASLFSSRAVRQVSSTGSNSFWIRATRTGDRPSRARMSNTNPAHLARSTPVRGRVDSMDSVFGVVFTVCEPPSGQGLEA